MWKVHTCGHIIQSSSKPHPLPHTGAPPHVQLVPTPLVSIKDEQGTLKRLIEPSSTEIMTKNIPEIVLDHSEEKYGVEINGKTDNINPQHGNGVFEALSHGLNHAGISENHSANSIRQAVYSQGNYRVP